ncbi:MAG: FprA family A-type flavoprotein [Bacteroidales bacterium]|nr:FprA family A-type flavoprotein [Bacteroidales bacterium]
MITRLSDSVRYIGCDDLDLDLFEGQYELPEGMAYNSYLILDEKVAVMDAVDASKCDEWLYKLEDALEGRLPDYLVVHHMEPDHSGAILEALGKYPSMKLVLTAQGLKMLRQFFENIDVEGRAVVVGDGETLDLGQHKLTFLTAPMVHWPEVMVSYDEYDGTLYSADAFGKFGALGKCGFYGSDDDDWACEARRYYFNIVGKYGAQVQTLLRKVRPFDVKAVFPLHGPLLKENLDYYYGLYDTWSSYGVETKGVAIAYTSVYGHTKEAVEMLATELESRGIKVAVSDLARCDMAEAVEDAFRYDRIVFATTTYNGGIFPFMQSFIDHLVGLGFRNKTVAFIENGSWAPVATRGMKALLEKCENLSFAEGGVKILSALNAASREQVVALAEELSRI